MKKYFTTDNLARLAIVFNVLAYIVYNAQIFLGSVHPNPVVWFIWSFITVLNFTSLKITTSDGMKSWLPTASSVFCILTFFIAIFNGEFKIPSWDNQAVFVLGVITSIAWKLTRSARVAQVILQGTLVFSFTPLFIQVAKNPSSENMWAWILWTITFVLQIILVIVRWKGQYMDLVYPVNMAICHLAVALLTQYDYHKVLEIIGGIIFLVAYAPYGWAIWSTRKLPFGAKGKTEPVKMTWLIWAILDIITWVTMWKSDTLNFQIDGCIIGNAVIVVLAFMYGKAGWTKVDIFCSIGAAFGLLLWWWTGDPVLGMKMALLTLITGSIPLFIATWKNPEGESKVAWTIYWSSSIFMPFSFPVWSVKDCAQVVAFFAIQCVMMSLIFVKPWVEKKYRQFILFINSK